MFSFFVYSNPNLITATFSKTDVHLEISLVSEKIFINDNSDWADLKSDGKCTGSGTYSNPYLIKDLIIDGGESDNCISIEDTDVYFIIENCTLYNSLNYPKAGIKLESVSNGQLINNNCSSNNYGLYIANSNNITITGNTANKNHDFGILLYKCNITTTSGNIVNYNIDMGIRVYSCNNVNVSGDNVANNVGFGIELYHCKNTTLLGNSVDNNDMWGIGLNEGSNNTISGNLISNNAMNGIILENSHNNTVKGNIFNNNSVYSILLDNQCKDNTISGNTVRENEMFITGWNSIVSGNIFLNTGLRISGSIERLCSHQIDSGNVVNGDPLYYYSSEINLGADNFTNAGQVIIVNCSNSLVNSLAISGSSNGISLYYCSNIDVVDNTLFNNTNSGICLYSSNYNNISNNVLEQNIWGGIFLYDCAHNEISENAINNNTFGIYLQNSQFNNISMNIVNNNKCGIYLDSSHDNTISGNIVLGNEVSISEEDSEGNLFENNDYGDRKSKIPGYGIILLFGVSLLTVIITYKKINYN